VQWTLRQVLTCLIGSTLLTSCFGIGGLITWKKIRHSRRLDSRYWITAIVQTGPEKEALKTSYLAELLDLSVDRPLSLYAYNLKKGKEKLLSSPLIVEATLSPLFPSTLYIDYEVRKPIAWLADYQNVAIDEQGYLFPVAPFLSPKELPEIYLGLPPFGAPSGGAWNTPLAQETFRLSLEILKEAKKQEGLSLKRIDVSNAFVESLGSREVVLFTEEEIWMQEESYLFPKILRLSPKDYQQQLAHFLILRRGILEEYRKQLTSSSQKGGKFAPRIIDLRIPELAFVENH